MLADVELNNQIPNWLDTYNVPTVTVTTKVCTDYETPLTKFPVFDVIKRFKSPFRHDVRNENGYYFKTVNDTTKVSND